METIERPTLPVPLRTSERKDLKRCPQRWEWAWVDGLKSLRPKNPFWFGIGVHEALALWYLPGLKRGPHPAETWEKYCADEERFIPQDYEEDELKYVDARELGKSMLEGYVDLYGKDSRWQVIATEQTFQKLVIDPAQAMAKKVTEKNAIVRYLGTFDGVYRDKRDGTIWLMEHKTAKAINLKHLPLDDQAGSYWWVATLVLRMQKLIGPKEQIVGIMYNFLRKGMPDPRERNERGVYLNKDGTESKRQPPPLFHREPVWRSEEERLMMLHRIQDEGKHKINLLTGVTPVFKNTTMDCSWDCDFYRMCMLHEAGGDWEEFRDLAFTSRDPYSDHRANRKSA